MFMSKVLPCGSYEAYLNLTTIEQKTYCVEVTSNGYRIVSFEYDTIDSDKIDDGFIDLSFESPEALLTEISPSYVVAFGESLCAKLSEIQRRPDNDNYYGNNERGSS
ncbi:GSK3-beta interaction protein [Scaptodrosophila lebanonensis]|uniref:GSK3-beta interaction protein n=1 Tax=Drosophila lebanonensis TaxID=7225 RepID=A0A6J2UHM6_DROLE|nr:GSK3-beta interaction protein [Scaptodrosophila lebanonensis]